MSRVFGIALLGLCVIAGNADAQLFGRRGGCSSGSCGSQYNGSALSTVDLQQLQSLFVAPQAVSKAEARIAAPSAVVTAPTMITVPLTMLTPVAPTATAEVQVAQAPVVVPNASAFALGSPTILAVPVAVEKPRRFFRRDTKQVTTATAKVETKTVPVRGLRSW